MAIGRGAEGPVTEESTHVRRRRPRHVSVTSGKAGAHRRDQPLHRRLETCTACADACLAEREVSHLIACVRLNLDCAAVCTATGSITARSNKAGHRQLLEAQLANCIAFCRACADECARHAMHRHCLVCAEACTNCADACTGMLAVMRMPA